MMWIGILVALSGYDVAKKANDLNNEGFVGQRADAVMTLYDADGKEVVTYKLTSLLREGTVKNGEVTATLIRFLAPPDSKGTALLTLEKEGDNESRWLYLSETRQVKQIAGSSKSASFKGSELAYEDLAASTLERYDYELAGERTVDGRACHQIVSTPKFEDSGYSKVVSCIDKQHFYVLESEFYDRAGKLLKKSAFKKCESISGKWRCHLSETVNLQTKRKTVLLTGRYQLGLELSERLFTVSQLQKQ